MSELLRTVRHIQAALVPYQFHLVALSAVVALALIVAINRVRTPPPGGETQDRWALATWQPYRAGAARSETLAAQIWIGDPSLKPKATVETPKLEVSQWRFIGTIEEGRSHLAMIETGDGRVKQLSVGDDLPNGTKIKDVRDGLLTYTSAETEQTVRLFDVKATSNAKQE